MPNFANQASSKNERLILAENSLTKRYKSIYGVIYEIAPAPMGQYRLFKVEIDFKIKEGKRVADERKLSYLLSSKEECFKYMYLVDTFNSETKNFTTS